MKCQTCDAELASADSACERCGTAPTLTSAPLTVTIDQAAAAREARPDGASRLRSDSGAIIANRYRILERVGQGGMGAVYKVLDLTLDRVVALKTVHPDMARNPRALEAFKKELILARQVTHKNVCRVFDLGEDRGAYLLTMEFVEGQSLGKAIRNRVKIPPAQAAGIMLQVAEGLEAAHETGIVHRDLKPDNIMIQADSRVLVMDFGIARPVQELGTSFSGTPAYASPEQLLGQAQDRRSDLYSLGLIFYELLCGAPPFPAPKTMTEARERAAMTAPPLAGRDHAIPKELSDIVARCLAVRAEERFATARELAAAIENWLHPKPFYVKPAFTWSTAAGVVVLAIGGVVWMNRPAPPEPPPVSVLVADFENKTGDAVFDGTLEPAVQVALEGASFVTAYDRAAAKRLIAQLRPGNRALDLEGARLVAEREGITAVLSGSIEPEGARQDARYQLALRTISPAGGRELAKEQRQTVARDQVLAAVGRLAAPVRRALGDRTSASEQIAAAETFTAASLEAANRYSAAQELASNPARRDEAVRAYEEAIRLDPNMGRAYAGLAVVYRNQSRPAEALRTYEQALSHIGRMSEREKLRTRGGYYITANNPGKAAEEFRALVREFPADTGGHSNLALALLFLRQPARALEEGRRAVEIYPKNLSFRTNVALYALYAADYQTAAREASAVLKENAQVQNAYIALALSALAQQHPREAEQWYRKLAALSPAADSRAATGLADLAAVEGRLEEAVRTLRRGIAADEARKDTDAAAHKYADLAQAYVKLDRMADAQRAAEHATTGTVDVGALTEAALAYVDSGAPAKAAVIGAAFGQKVGEGNQVSGRLIEGYARMATAPVEAIDILGSAQKTLDTWLGHYLLGRANLLAKAYVEAQAEFETCLKRSGESTAAFLDEEPTARLLPPVSFYLAQAAEGLNDGAAAEAYQRFLAFQAPNSQDRLAAAARSRVGGTRKPAEPRP